MQEKLIFEMIIAALGDALNSGESQYTLCPLWATDGGSVKPDYADLDEGDQLAAELGRNRGGWAHA